MNNELPLKEKKDQKKIRTRKNSFIATVYKIPKFVKVTKTISVVFHKRYYDEKYKRYYKKTYKHLVHYEPKEEIELKEGDSVRVYSCRRISPRKSKITYGWV